MVKSSILPILQTFNDRFRLELVVMDALLSQLKRECLLRKYPLFRWRAPYQNSS